MGMRCGDSAWECGESGGKCEKVNQGGNLSIVVEMTQTSNGNDKFKESGEKSE